MKMQHVAIARIFVENKFTEMALTIDAHAAQLINIMIAITSKWNSVRKIIPMELEEDANNQTAEMKKKIN